MKKIIGFPKYKDIKRKIIKASEPYEVGSMAFPKPLRKCKKCGKEFKKTMETKSYCSSRCQRTAWALNTGRKKGTVERYSPEWLERIKATTKGAMQRPDVKVKISKPKGPMSETHKTLISKSLKGKMPKFIPRLSGEYNPMFGKHRSLEWKRLQSAKLAGKMPKNMMFSSNGSYPNVQRGTYLCSKGDVYFRSKWEANYALHLDFLVKHGVIEKWEFEPETFIFEQIAFGTRSYTPDFKVWDKKGITYHEVKGWMDPKSATKLKRMAKYYPDIKLVLIDEDYYKTLKKQVSKLEKWY